MSVIPQAFAQPSRLSAAEIVQALSASEHVVATRSVVPPARGIAVEPAAESPVRPSVDLQVNFDFNSSTLSTDAMLTLDQLALALADPALAGGQFQIAGHTDAKGTDAYNQALSERRAAAVRAYVAGKSGALVSHLTAIGYGKTRLLDPDHPEAAINRRVQVTRIGG